jgi:SAM-dependent methyltransferase
MNMNKIIWSCWFQGRRDAPDLVKRCLSSWETLNPGWDFRCLDAESVGRYVDLGEHVDLRRQTITAASLSDILRMLLLHEYGGVWVDATLYCNQPLDEWLPLAMGTGFFAFSKPAHDRALSTWFIAASPGNRLLAKWAARALRYWRGRSHSNDFFWLHHQFGELYSIDRETRIDWESVPRISADGPHAIQAAGMYEPAGSAGRRVDWTTPVFKLTHRLDEDAYRPGCLVHHVLHSRELVRTASEEALCDEAQDPASIAGLRVSTENLGDHVQILAALRLSKRLGLAPEVLIDRDDEIATAAALDARNQPLGILLNGWFKTNPAEWPPHPNLSPVYLGYHIRLFQAPTLVSPEAIEHYRRFGPIGCRDRHTLSLLRSHGVDSFLSHCLSLASPRRLLDTDGPTETFIVSRDRRILDYLPATIRSSEFLCHYSGTRDFGNNMQRAAELLELYRSRAKLIVTTMLHCAMPAIAMGIPVVVFFPLNEGESHRSDRERFSSLEEMIPVFHPTEANRVDWRGYTADVGRIKLALIDRLFEMARRWGRIPGTRLGPIAPASALPLPLQGVPDRLTNDPSHMHTFASASSPDRYRWGNPLSYKPDWNDRARLAAPLIPDGAKVLEIGVGAGNLKRLIQHRCVYVGADLEPLDTDTRSLDLDCEPLPDEHYDCIVALGVFEYLHRSREAAAKIASASDHIVISYCCTHEGFPSVSEIRGRRGWVNHFSEAEFTRMFALLGLDLVSRAPYNAADDFEQVVFEFRRVA